MSIAVKCRQANKAAMVRLMGERNRHAREVIIPSIEEKCLGVANNHGRECTIMMLYDEGVVRNMYLEKPAIPYYLYSNVINGSWLDLYLTQDAAMVAEFLKKERLIIKVECENSCYTLLATWE